MRSKIGECLIQAGLITEGDLRIALAEHDPAHEHIGQVLVRMNFATEQQIAETLAQQLGFPYLALSGDVPDNAVAALVSRETARRFVCLPIALEGNLLTLAMADPLLFGLVQEIETRTGYRVRQVVAARSEIVEAIQAAYRSDHDLSDSPGLSDTAAAPMEDESPSSAELVDSLIRAAVAAGVTDIHIEPTNSHVRIRHRLDGVLTDVGELPVRAHEGLVARIKLIAGMDVDETRLPQDGRLSASREGAGPDFRVSTLRTALGERVVMQAIAERRRPPALEDLGPSAHACEEIRELLRCPSGLLLVVGPGGSGKTTTVSAAMAIVGAEREYCMTIEAPIEYEIGAGVVQAGVDGLPSDVFADVLGSVLAQDPEVIFVGELRDLETAAAVVRTAQGGPLVISTIAAADVSSALSRMAQWGIDSLALANALVGVVTQRLARRLCVRCRQPFVPDAEFVRGLNVPDDHDATVTFYRAAGCDQCHHTGYRGRIGLFEVMRIGDSVRGLIASRASGDDLRDAAIASGTTLLGEDCLAKVQSGVVAVEDLRRTVAETRDLRTLCSGCGAPVGADFAACPRCGTRQGATCRHCGRALRRGWTFCPYCAGTGSAGTVYGRLS